MIMTALEDRMQRSLPATFLPSNKKAQISNCSSGAHQQFLSQAVHQAAVQEHVPLDKRDLPGVLSFTFRLPL